MSNCKYNVPLSDVLQLMNNEGDLFYAYIDMETFKFTLANDNIFDVEKLTNIFPNSAILNKHITIDNLINNKESIKMFDLETIRRVLLEIRGCSCDDVSKALLLGFNNLVYTDGLTSYIKSGKAFAQYSAENMNVPFRSLRNRIENFCVEGV